MDNRRQKPDASADKHADDVDGFRQLSKPVVDDTGPSTAGPPALPAGDSDCPPWGSSDAPSIRAAPLDAVHAVHHMMVMMTF